MDTFNDITVVIPSYNRAHLLKKTIPTYAQQGVAEIILIDDCSSDNTAEVVYEIQQNLPILSYIRQPRNMKQTAAKNAGIKKCKTKWIYFGDDDSILVPGSIDALIDTALSTKAQIVGARALYMKVGEDKMPLEDLITKNTIYAKSVTDIVNLNNLTANFNLAYTSLIEVPFCQACLLMQADLAKKVMFDEGYTGNAYREETDFTVRCSKLGAKIIYDSRAIQYNLPPNIAVGGARGKAVWRYKWYCIRNNWRFLNANWNFLKNKYQLNSSSIEIQLKFSLGYIYRPIIRFVTTGHLKTQK